VSLSNGIDHNKALSGDDLTQFVNAKLFPYLMGFKQRADYLISNWLRNRNTIEFLGIWEQINNPGFNPIEFDGIKKDSGLNSFILTAKQWIERTGAIGIQSKAGRYAAPTRISTSPWSSPRGSRSSSSSTSSRNSSV